MDNVERAVLEDFKKWMKDHERKGIENIRKDLAEYMVQIYQITDQDINILDILDMMIAPDVETSFAANGVRANVIACMKTPAEARIETSRSDLTGPAIFVADGDQFHLVTTNKTLLLAFSAPDSRNFSKAEFVQDKVIICGTDCHTDRGTCGDCAMPAGALAALHLIPAAKEKVTVTLTSIALEV